MHRSTSVLVVAALFPKMRRPTLSKRRPVDLLVVLSVTWTLFFYCYYCAEYAAMDKTNTSQYFNQSLVSCDTDYINSEKLSMEQDDPCILSVIRDQFLHPPSQKKLNLDDPINHNPSMGQSDIVLDVLKDKKDGFFIECGALDGELRSNTLYMEQHLGWQGVLIEADPKNFRKVTKKNRRAWTVPACLSTSPYPKTVVFNQAFNTGRISQNEKDDEKRDGSVRVQCFPIFSILSALNRTQVDYFSLDIEGDEFTVLKTIPWNRVDITMLSVEFIHDREDKKQIKEYMVQKGYEVVEPDPLEFGDSVANDFIFKKREMTHR